MSAENIHPKIQEYVDRVENGEEIASFGEIPDTWKEEIAQTLENRKLRASADKEKAEILRQELRRSAANISENATDEYAEFRVKHGETDTGFFWYEYRNKKAKEMKEAGTFEWGKERIYFDVAIKDCEALRDLVFEISKDNQIPIAFKYIDDTQTYAVHKDGTETRFVANFASSDDARAFYSALQKNEKYQHLLPDRTNTYNGIRIDALAEYASGYREKRNALARIMSATKNNLGRYVYVGESGKEMSISQEQFDMFKKQDEEMKQALAIEEEKWQKLREEV